jgi:hypothetical protein
VAKRYLKLGSLLGAVITAAAAPCVFAPNAWADSVDIKGLDIKGQGADLSVTTEASAPKGVLRAASQVLVQPHIAPQIETGLQLTLGAGQRADSTPVWAGVTPFAAFAWTHAGAKVQADWKPQIGPLFHLELSDDVRTQTYRAPDLLTSRPMSLDDSQGARLSATLPLRGGVTVVVASGVGADAGAVDLLDDTDAMRRVALRSTHSDVSSQLDWIVNPAVSVRVSDKIETGAMSWGDVATADGYVALQPKAALVFKPLPDSEWTLSVEHSDTPLNPGKFAALAQAAESSSIPAATARLRPDETWGVKAAVSQKFGTTGLFTLAYTQADLRSSTELLEIAPGVQAPGSVSGGQRQQWDAALNVPLSALGFDALSLQSSGLWRRSEIVDPITGVLRAPSGETPYEAKVGLTADLRDRNVKLGVLGQAVGPTTVYSLARVDATTVAPSLGAFVEYHPGAFALRLQLDNLAGAERRYQSTQYVGTRDGGAPEEIDRRIVGGPGFMLSFRRAL